ncbi:MAG: nucleoside hydrolase [Gemmatimonadota bacterium]
MTRQMIIDTDTASDDAVALLMALRWPDVEVRAITTVAGNVPLEQGTRNALYTVELCGSDVPVYKGAARPLKRELVVAEYFHGRDGLGDQGYPPPGRGPAEGDAVDVLIDTIRENHGLILVTLGPLTNVALALEREPDIVGSVGRCVVMGGAACTVGNVSPAAEYNMWVDPDAAQAVFTSGMPVEMVGWELCRGAANFTDIEMESIRSFGTELARFAIDCNETAIEANRNLLGDPGLSLPDPVAMGIALDPALCVRSSRHHVQVETASDLTRGMTVVDQLGVSGEATNSAAWSDLAASLPNVTVCWELDVPAWKHMLTGILERG